MSTMTGTRLRMRSKSSIVQSISAALVIARKCRTALVEPPTAMMTLTAFSIDFLVMMSRGRKLFLIASTKTIAESWALVTFSVSTLDIVDE